MSTQWAYLVCPECDTGFDTQSDLDGHTGAFHSANVVTDTGAEWVGRPVPTTRWREE